MRSGSRASAGVAPLPQEGKDRQHLRFAIVGGGVGIVKGLSELRTRWQAVFIKCWPLLLIILGILLMR